MRSRAVWLWGALSCLAWGVACETSETPDDAGGSETGDGDGDPGDGDGDELTECEILQMGDATYPGDCECAEPGEPCVQGCFIPDGMITCAEVCAGIGETCVEGGCAGGTYTEGTESSCPAPSEYGQAQLIGCDAPVPIKTLGDGEPYGAECCCTQAS